MKTNDKPVQKKKFLKRGEGKLGADRTPTQGNKKKEEKPKRNEQESIDSDVKSYNQDLYT